MAKNLMKGMREYTISSLHIEDDGGTTKKTWNKQIKKLKEFIEKKLKLELTTWEDVHPHYKTHLLYC